MQETVTDFTFNDEDLFFNEGETLIFEDGDQEDEELDHSANSWNIMIVDDDAQVHQVTKLALQSMKFEDKTLNFTSAYSAEEAKRLIAHHPDTAIILLDVVMESNDSGLDVAKHIREVLKNEGVRIILRTGQPGQVSEDSVISNYDINDYKVKTELTQQKLLNTIMFALRSYRDVMKLDTYKKKLVELTNDFAKYDTERKVTDEQLEQAIVQHAALEAISKERDQLLKENKLLNKQSQRLTKLNTDKNRLFAIIAHDLKEPFQPLLGYSEILRSLINEATRSELKDMSDQIHHSAKNLYHLLENLLQWSRTQLRGMAPKAEKIQLQGLINENFAILNENAKNKQITLRHTVAEDFLVYADRHLLNAVLRNLISNALKFSLTGNEVTISAKRSWNWRNQEGPTELVEVLVSDTGVGISPKDLKKLFKINSDHTTLNTTNKLGSKGLGLILCKEMIELNGGEIWIESQLGKGTTVRFTLPVEGGADS